jgi:hypothetical protein
MYDTNRKIVDLGAPNTCWGNSDFYMKNPTKCKMCMEEMFCKVKIQDKKYESRKSVISETIIVYLKLHEGVGRHEIQVGINYQRWGGLDIFNEAMSLLESTKQIIPSVGSEKIKYFYAE